MTDLTLRQFLAGALEPPDQEAVERALAASPEVRDRLAVLLATTVAAPEPGWILPPPAIRGPLRAQVEPVATMGAGPGWLVIRFDVPPGRHDARVVVLERGSHPWEVLYPGPDDPPLRTSDLPIEDGRSRLDLAVPPGDRRIAVLLTERAPATMGDRWAPVREALHAGEAVAVTFDLRTEPIQ